MPIYRNSDQSSQTLHHFYTYFYNNASDYYKQSAELMLKWLDKINQTFVETEIWGLTSHERLVLQTKDDYESTAFVIIYASIDEYHIEYLMPKEIEPWEDAYVKGATKSLDEAIEMLKIAILKSKGWKETNELNIK